jgi:hypothetical protein
LRRSDKNERRNFRSVAIAEPQLNPEYIMPQTFLVAGAPRPRSACRGALPPDRALRFSIDPLSPTPLDRLDNAWRVGAVNRG